MVSRYVLCLVLLHGVSRRHVPSCHAISDVLVLHSFHHLTSSHLTLSSLGFLCVSLPVVDNDRKFNIGIGRANCDDGNVNAAAACLRFIGTGVCKPESPLQDVVKVGRFGNERSLEPRSSFGLRRRDVGVTKLTESEAPIASREFQQRDVSILPFFAWRLTRRRPGGRSRLLSKARMEREWHLPQVCASCCAAFRRWLEVSRPVSSLSAARRALLPHALRPRRAQQGRPGGQGHRAAGADRGPGRAGARAGGLSGASEGGASEVLAAAQPAAARGLGAGRRGGRCAAVDGVPGPGSGSTPDPTGLGTLWLLSSDGRTAMRGAACMWRRTACGRMWRSCL